MAREMSPAVYSCCIARQMPVRVSNITDTVCHARRQLTLLSFTRSFVFTASPPPATPPPASPTLNRNQSPAPRNSTLPTSAPAHPATTPLRQPASLVTPSLIPAARQQSTPQSTAVRYPQKSTFAASKQPPRPQRLPIPTHRCS